MNCAFEVNNNSATLLLSSMKDKTEISLLYYWSLLLCVNSEVWKRSIREKAGKEIICLWWHLCYCSWPCASLWTIFDRSSSEWKICHPVIEVACENITSESFQKFIRYIILNCYSHTVYDWMFCKIYVCIYYRIMHFQLTWFNTF